MTADSKKKTDWFKGLKDLFNEYDDEKTNTIPEDERKGYMDNTQICMIVPKTIEFKELLLSTYDVQEFKIPEIHYESHVEGVEIKCSYSVKFLKIFYMMAQHYDHCIIKIGCEKPLTLEVDDFIFILAPRIET